MPRTQARIPEFARVLIFHDPAKGHTQKNGCRWGGLVTFHTRQGTRLGAVNPQQRYPVMAITDKNDNTTLVYAVPPVGKDESTRKAIRHIDDTVQGTLRRTKYDCTADVDPGEEKNSSDDSSNSGTPAAVEVPENPNLVHPIHRFGGNQHSQLVAGLPG